ncbi:MAG: hypothetical protein J2P48_12275 [Alphaproteobacteria bacterium]|nr:hypothetical protein [Alphaproteobacteria bacterium]
MLAEQQERILRELGSLRMTRKRSWRQWAGSMPSTFITNQTQSHPTTYSPTWETVGVYDTEEQCFTTLQPVQLDGHAPFGADLKKHHGER